MPLHDFFHFHISPLFQSPATPSPCNSLATRCLDYCNGCML